MVKKAGIFLIIVLILSLAVIAAVPPPPPAPPSMGSPQAGNLSDEQNNTNNTQQNTTTEIQEPENNTQQTQEIEMPSKSSGKLFVFIAMLITITMLGAGTVSYTKYSKKTKSNERINKLKNYIQTNIAMGYGQDAIKQQLLNYNWNEQEVNRAFNEIVNQPPKSI